MSFHNSTFTGPNFIGNVYDTFKKPVPFDDEAKDPSSPSPALAHANSPPTHVTHNMVSATSIYPFAFPPFGGVGIGQDTNANAGLSGGKYTLRRLASTDANQSFLSGARDGSIDDTADMSRYLDDTSMFMSGVKTLRPPSQVLLSRYDRKVVIKDDPSIVSALDETSDASWRW